MTSAVFAENMSKTKKQQIRWKLFLLNNHLFFFKFCNFNVIEDEAEAKKFSIKRFWFILPLYAQKMSHQARKSNTVIVLAILKNQKFCFFPFGTSIISQKMWWRTPCIKKKFHKTTIFLANLSHF